MEGNEIEKAAGTIWLDGVELSTHLANLNRIIAAKTTELTRTNAQLDEMVTKYNELSKKYADLYSKYYGNGK